ncbi:MAG: acylneuraminate cytidylyltransferase family protein [Acidobacteriota bacterium]
MAKEVIALIPARGNSKGIPGKNIREFAGKPLIAHSIGAARKARHIDRVVVSTESVDVARVARRYRAEVLDRPPGLSQDDTPIKWVIDHAMDVLSSKGRPARAIVVLYATAPLRTAEDIDRAVAMALRLQDYDSVAGVCAASVAPFGGLVIEKGRLSYLVPAARRMYQRQLAPPWFALNGAIWVLNPARMNRVNLSLLGKRSYGFVMPAERSIDIDTEHDWEMAEFLARRGWARRSRP